MDGVTNWGEQILVGVLRHYVTQLLNSPPKKQPLNVIREQSVFFSILYSSCAQSYIQLQLLLRDSHF